MDAEKDEKAVDEKKLKQAKNLFNSSIKERNSVFCSVDKRNKSLVTKARRLVYAKGKVFIKLYNEVENKNYLYIDIKMDQIYPSSQHLSKENKY